MAFQLFEMANLTPSITGLPVHVFVSYKGNAKHGARVKVSIIRGKFSPRETVSVPVENPRLIGNDKNKISASDFQIIKRFIETNKETILAFWNEKLTDDELRASIVPVNLREAASF